MKNILFLTFCMLILSGIAKSQIDEKNTAKAFLMNALNKRNDFVAGAGTSYIIIKGDGLKNSSGIKTLNYNYFIGTSGFSRINDTKAFTVLGFTAGKMHANMPGYSRDTLTIFSAKSLDAWYLTAEVSMGYQLIANKAFYAALETGPYFDLLGKIELSGDGITDSRHLSPSDEEYNSFNWGWSVSATAAFRSLFANLSMGTTIKDYFQVSDKTMTIPFRTRLSFGIRLTSEYGEKDASIIDNLTGLR